MGGMSVRSAHAALPRARTGRGQEVQSALFETTCSGGTAHDAVCRHRAAAAPMPSRISAWGVYDVFTVATTSRFFSQSFLTRNGRSFVPRSFDDLKMTHVSQQQRSRTRAAELVAAAAP